MKCVEILPFVALGSAFVIPDATIFNALPIHGIEPVKESVVSAWGTVADTLAASIARAAEVAENALDDGLEKLLGDDISIDELDGGHKQSNLTIYELISQSNYTTKFAELIDEHDVLVKLLNSTKANHTLFVPVDSAFEHIPKDHKKPSKEFLEAFLSYHIGDDLYPAGKLLGLHTLPTVLEEPLLGDNPQRLRVRVSLSGVRVNFYSKVIAANIGATNGVIHAVNHFLIPPPTVGKELTLFPGKFSTLLYAYDKTDFVKYIHGVKLAGSTVFAPSNNAFAALGPRANAFLFNTEKGLGYLKAILKYHIVANETLYSDTLYGSKSEGSKTNTLGHEHFELPTLLEGKSVGVDVARWGGWITLKVNGRVRVSVQDGIAKDGVIQVVERVLIPPHRHGKEGEEQQVDGEISVEDLKERLAEYVEGDLPQQKNLEL